MNKIETGIKEFVSGLKRTKKWNKGTCGSHIKKKKDKTNKQKEMDGMAAERQREKREVLFFFPLSFLSQIPEFLTFGFRRDKHEKCSTRRGLRVSTRNTRFHREFR